MRFIVNNLASLQNFLFFFVTNLTFFF
jgi:hypothetical protein